MEETSQNLPFVFGDLSLKKSESQDQGQDENSQTIEEAKEEYSHDSRITDYIKAIFNTSTKFSGH